MRQLLGTLILLCMILCATLPCHAGGLPHNECERQFAFAESLFGESDFYRAIGEYKRLIFLCPGSQTLCEKAFFKIGACYFEAEQWQKAREAFDDFLHRFPGSTKVGDALYCKGMSEKHLSLHEEALDTFARVSETQTGEAREKAIYESALILVDREQWKRAGEMFARIPAGSAYYDSAVVFSTGLENIGNLPHKSPTVAGSLAAVLPGAGHLYTERPRDALVAFLLNGAFIWSAIELFEDDKYVTGGIVTFFELGWYTGNIYSAVGSAHKFNKRSRETFLQGLKDRAHLSYFFDRDTASNGIILSMSF